MAPLIDQGPCINLHVRKTNLHTNYHAVKPYQPLTLSAHYLKLNDLIGYFRKSGPWRPVYDVLSKLWCGQGLDTWVFDTKENPYQRFYRCKIVLQKKTEPDLFKWIDEAILDEVRIVDAKHLDLLHDLQALSKNFNVHLESQRSWIVARDGDM
ncbi:unnamed protein product, partial [Eruca vesicaria subsp. sativa]|nr:unnamed protein product [Eruca vesicaria subsp. sativa]